MKSFLSHTIAFVAGLALASVIAFVVFAMQDVGEAMLNWGEPVTLSDSAVRTRISDIGIGVPERSEDLYVFHVGWQDHTAFVGMTLTGDDAWSAVETATGFAQAEFELTTAADVQCPGDFGEEYATSAWELRETGPLFVATKRDTTGGRTAYFDPKTGRLLVNDWSN